MEMGRGHEPTDPFILVFSRSFEGGLVCLRLKYLESPRKAPASDPSVKMLKHALEERDGCSKRLKWMGPSYYGKQEGGCHALEPFQDPADDVQ